MTDTTPQSALDNAQRLAQRARRSSRWYATYLAIFGVAAFAVSVIIGTAPGSTGLLFGMCLWLVAIVGLTIYAQRQKATVKRFGLLHGLVIGGWAALWFVTVLFGTLYFTDRIGWWIAGGLACAIPPLVGAAVVLRRTR